MFSEMDLSCDTPAEEERYSHYVITNAYPGEGGRLEVEDSSLEFSRSKALAAMESLPMYQGSPENGWMGAGRWGTFVSTVTSQWHYQVDEEEELCCYGQDGQIWNSYPFYMSYVTMSQEEVRNQCNQPAPAALTQAFVLVKREIDLSGPGSGAGNTETVTVLGSLELRIEEGQMISSQASANFPLPEGVSVQGGTILLTSPPVAPGNKASYDLLPIEVVELSPKTKDEDNNDIAGSEKPNSGKPLTPFVEVDPNANKIAHRELKVMIGSALKDKKVTWTLEALPGATPATIRGQWEDSPTHKDRFEASTAYGANGFRKVSQSSGETTVGADGHTAIRVNVPPIGFNQVRIKIQIEGMSTPINLIDMEVPAVVVIDPGHGGTANLPGASWNNATSPSGVLEKAMALSYGTAARDALRTKRQQDKLNLRVFMTRTTDVNVSGQDRAAKAKDNGADVIFIIHFNASDAHTARGTLEVVRDSGNVNAAEDTNLANTVIDLMVPAMRQYDTGANKRYSVVNNTAVASDTNLGNTSAYHPIRAAYCEVEFIDLGEHTADTSDDLVDILLNTGPNAAAVKTAVANAMRDGILQDLRNQPQP